MRNNIGLFLTKRAFRDPNLEAIFEPASDRRFTYHEFNERSNRIANTLLDLGVGFGERVGVLLMNGVEFLETFFACGKIGAVCVPPELATGSRRVGVHPQRFGHHHLGVRGRVRGGGYRPPQPLDIGAPLDPGVPSRTTRTGCCGA